MSSFGGPVEAVPARLVHLLSLGPRVFPALQRPDDVRLASGLRRIVVGVSEERALHEELAACSAAEAVAGPAMVDREYEAREEPRQFAVERSVLLSHARHVVRTAIAIPALGLSLLGRPQHLLEGAPTSSSCSQ